jgi:hypothetical protein
MIKEKYQPGKMEVLREMGKDFLYYAGKLQSDWKNVKESGKIFLATGAGLSLFPYIIPTTVQYLRPQIGDEVGAEDCTKLMITGGVSGLVTGIAGLVTQLAGYAYLCQHNHSEVLEIPVATNIASLGYEWYRSARRRTVEHHENEEIKLRFAEDTKGVHDPVILENMVNGDDLK